MFSNRLFHHPPTFPPFIAYFKQATAPPFLPSLKGALCTNPTCTQFNTIVLDTDSVSAPIATVFPRDRKPAVIHEHRLSSGVTLFRLSKCGDVACSTVSHADLVSTPSGSGSYAIFAGIDAFSDSRPVISLMNRTPPTPPHVESIVCNDPNCATAPTIVNLYPFLSTDILGGTTGVKVQRDGNPFVVFAMTDQPSNTGFLRGVKCDSADCTLNHLVTIDSTIMPLGILGSWIKEPKMTLDSNGFPVIVYQKTTGTLTNPYNNLYIVRCGNLDCSIVTSNSFLFLPVTPMLYSVTVPSDNLPFLTFTDNTIIPPTTLGLKCNDAACTSFTYVYLGVTTLLADYATSITIAGKPAITYFANDTNGMPPVFQELRLVECSDVQCSVLMPTITMDTGVAGFPGSIAIDS